MSKKGNHLLQKLSNFEKQLVSATEGQNKEILQNIQKMYHSTNVEVGEIEKIRSRVSERFPLITWHGIFQKLNIDNEVLKANNRDWMPFCQDLGTIRDTERIALWMETVTAFKEMIHTGDGAKDQQGTQPPVAGTSNDSVAKKNS